MELSDKQLITRVLEGDDEGFAELLERHRRVLWAFVRGREPLLDRARDLYQETVVRALEQLGSLRNPNRFRAWVLAMARNTMVQGLRKRSEVALSQTPESLHDERSSADALEGLERRELGARIQAAMQQLPPRQREVCQLRADGELSHAEIAQLLGITEETARANFYQGLRKLRAALDGEYS